MKKQIFMLCAFMLFLSAQVHAISNSDIKFYSEGSSINTWFKSPELHLNPDDTLPGSGIFGCHDQSHCDTGIAANQIQVRSGLIKGSYLFSFINTYMAKSIFPNVPFQYWTKSPEVVLYDLFFVAQLDLYFTDKRNRGIIKCSNLLLVKAAINGYTESFFGVISQNGSANYLMCELRSFDDSILISSMPTTISSFANMNEFNFTFYL